MDSAAWLNRGYQLTENIKIGKMLSCGADWQIYACGFDGNALVVKADLVDKWDDTGLLGKEVFSCVPGFEDTLFIFASGDSIIGSMENGPYADHYSDLEAFAVALKESRSIIPDASFGDAVYLEMYSRLLPTFSDCSIDDKTVLGRFITGGIDISTDAFDKLCRYTGWLAPSKISEAIYKAGLSSADGDVIELIKDATEKEKSAGAEKKRKNITHKNTDRFELPGRPALEEFFNEHVIDIILNEEKYKRVGIDFPAAIILYGPPGCGKTYAVDKLTDYLGWPSYSINSGSIGSPYIHDTSKKVAELFDTAIENAPSVIVIDEMEAFLTDRNKAQASGQHHVEEVAEFLRRIPEAISKRVLVVAMTNMIDSIDPAILRRGRFDHIIEVTMPSKEEVASLLSKLFADLPMADDVDTDAVARKLAGHPLSDVTYVIKEAGRLSVKENEDTITQELLLRAIDTLPKAEKEEKRHIGFISDDD